MAQKQKTAKTADDAARISRQKKVIQKLKKKENWMKWALAVALIIILLLLLFIGYATDWTMGLRKDAATTSIGTDSLKTESDAGATAPSGGGSVTTDATTERTGTSSNTSSTTNNSTSTTNNGTTTTTDEGALTRLYNQTNAGDSIDEVISQAGSLGISVDCTETLLIKECTFTFDGQSFSTKSVSGLVTSVSGL
jgi:hypothetical protein